jgi:hypothetical protein
LPAGGNLDISGHIWLGFGSPQFLCMPIAVKAAGGKIQTTEAIFFGALSSE